MAFLYANACEAGVDVNSVSDKFFSFVEVANVLLYEPSGGIHISVNLVANLL